MLPSSSPQALTPPDTAVPLLPMWPLSRTCQRLAHELRFYNLEAAQLDERLRPAEPDYRLVLVGGGGADEAEPDPSQWLQCFDDKAGGWGRLQDMSIDRPNGCGVAAVGTYLYAFGGEAGDAEEPECMTMYNMASRKMAEGAKLPRALMNCSGVACGGLVYSLGGNDVELWEFVADMSTYNPELDSWVPGLPLPFAVEGIAAVEHMGSIYACGGRMDDDGTRSAALLRLDPRTRAYTTLSTMPTPTAYAAATVVAGRMYVPGGVGGAATAAAAVSSLQCYDMAAGRWDTSCASMVEARHSHGVAALHGEVWAVGGQVDDELVLASVELYSPRLNTWRAGVPLPLSCYDGTCVVVQS